jgi:hypothetical protein
MGLMIEGSPPASFTASRIAARSTTHGTPVKSCRTTRAGMKGNSRSGRFSGRQEATSLTWSAVARPPSDCRNAFSRRMRMVNGVFARSSSPAFSRAESA